MELRGIITEAHTSAVLCVALYNNKLYTGGEDSTIRIWDYDTLKLYRTLPAHTGAVTALENCKDYKCLISSSSDGSIIVWTWNSGMKILSTEKTRVPIMGLAWASSKQLLFASGKDQVLVYYLKDGKTLTPAVKHILTHHSDIVTCCMVYDSKLITGSHDRSIQIIEPSTGRKILDIQKSHHAGISAITIDDDTETIITGSYDQRVQIWSKDGTAIHELKGFSDTITGLAYNPVTKTIWVAANSPQPVIFDTVSTVNVTEFITGILPNKKSEKLLWLPETQELMGTTNLREVILWRWNSRRPITSLHSGDQSTEALTYSPNTFFSVGGDNIVKMWDSAKQKANEFVYHPKPLAAHIGSVHCVVFDKDLDVLITGSDDMTIKVWSYVPLPKKLSPGDKSEFGSRNDSLSSSLHGSKHDSLVLLDDPNFDPALISRVTGFRAPYTMCEHKDRVSGLAVALVDNQHYTISVSWDQTICVWNTNTTLLSWKIESAHDGPITDVAFSNETQEFITCAAGEFRVPVWSFSQKKCIRNLIGHDAEVMQVKWNTVTSTWVTCSHDHTIRTWSKDGNETEGDITAFCIDLTYGYIVGATNDHMYDPDASFSPALRSYVGHEDVVSALLHIPETGQYISASWDRTIRVWRAYHEEERPVDSAASSAPALVAPVSNIVVREHSATTTAPGLSSAITIVAISDGSSTRPSNSSVAKVAEEADAAIKHLEDVSDTAGVANLIATRKPQTSLLTKLAEIDAQMNARDDLFLGKTTPPSQPPTTKSKKEALVTSQKESGRPV